MGACLFRVKRPQTVDWDGHCIICLELSDRLREGLCHRLTMEDDGNFFVCFPIKTVNLAVLFRQLEETRNAGSMAERIRIHQALRDLAKSNLRLASETDGYEPIDFDGMHGYLMPDEENFHPIINMCGDTCPRCIVFSERCMEHASAISRTGASPVDPLSPASPDDYVEIH